MDQVETSVDVSLGLKIKNWQIYFDIHVVLKSELHKDKKWGTECIMSFPSFPLFQLKIGIRFEIGFTISIGVEGTFTRDEKEGYSFGFKVLVEFEIYAKLIAYAQAGLFVGKEKLGMSVYGGIDGTILDARTGFKLYIYLTKNENEFYLYFNLYIFQARAYIETKVKILFVNWKETIVEKKFGMTTPIIGLGLYFKYNYYGEVIEKREIKDINISF